MDKITSLRQAIRKATTDLSSHIDNADEFKKRKTELDDLKGQLERAVEAEQAMAALAEPADGSGARAADYQPAAGADGWSPGNASAATKRDFGQYVRRARANLSGTEHAFRPDTHFRSLGEQLQAIARQSLAQKAGQPFSDNRLVRAPVGASEVDPTGGGFLLQTDFAAGIFMLAHDMGEILGAVNPIPISANANGIKVRGVDETSRATGSRWGGVQSYWVGEGTTVTPSKPKFRLLEFDLKKLMSLMYATDELLQDSTALGAIAGQAFSEEVMFMTEDGIFSGTGAGTLQGVLNSPCRVTVDKQTGAKAKTIVKEDIDNMWSRMWMRSRKNARWYINQDIEPQLNSLSQVIGTGGVPVYLPPGGLSQSPYGTLYGRPVIPTEYSPTLGAEGDIMLADFSQYGLADKSGVNAASSMHVAFLTDEMVFRITYRVDGQPMWHQPLTPAQGSATKSPFVTLAARA